MCDHTGYCDGACEKEEEEEEDQTVGQPRVQDWQNHRCDGHDVKEEWEEEGELVPLEQEQ